MNEARAAGVQTCCSTTRLHCPCLITTPCTFLLLHTASSLMILRDSGGGDDSQKAI